VAFPKTIEIAGIRVQVDSWQEIREAVEELGGNVAVPSGEGADGDAPPRRDPSNHARSGLAPTDRALVEQFVEAGARGVLTQTLGNAIGARGKGVRPALDRWSRRVQLVTEENASAFEPVKRFDGRGFRMTEHYLRVAAQMLGR
jgi:hypothetical protein